MKQQESVQILRVKALLYALLFCKDVGCQMVHVEFEDKVICQMIHSGNSYASCNWFVFSSLFHNISFHSVSKNCNKVSLPLARLA